MGDFLVKNLTFFRVWRSGALHAVLCAGLAQAEAVADGAGREELLDDVVDDDGEPALDQGLADGGEDALVLADLLHLLHDLVYGVPGLHPLLHRPDQVDTQLAGLLALHLHPRHLGPGEGEACQQQQGTALHGDLAVCTDTVNNIDSHILCGEQRVEIKKTSRNRSRTTDV